MNPWTRHDGSKQLDSSNQENTVPSFCPIQKLYVSIFSISRDFSIGVDVVNFPLSQSIKRPSSFELEKELGNNGCFKMAFSFQTPPFLYLIN